MLRIWSSSALVCLYLAISMRLFLIVILCSFLAPAIAIILKPPSSSTQNLTQPLSTGSVIPDVTYSDVYKIVNCNAYEPARLNPPAHQLRTFLSEAWQALRDLLVDLPNGTNSRYGYSDLFKSNYSANAIVDVVRNVVPGYGMDFQRTVPILACLTPASSTPLLRVLYLQGCLGGRKITSFPEYSYIGLCPEFFELGRLGWGFPKSFDCPTLNRTTNKVEEASRPLTDVSVIHIINSKTKTCPQLGVV